ncbi:hypothetical protein THRCLA_08839 [Thraustotheca clavata]|uniref:Uncharacterized protein n=1 Tax=Thraustotheca clavata TaxID=74557 RepID=A0A1V9Z273_9STRA|nr:hypothetical protein THRCLA_08839 [Thraustotheca clavata]
MIYLKYKVVDLQAQYDNLYSALNEHWKEIIRRERQRWQDAMKENLKLKNFLKEYIAYSELLVDVMKRKPRLSKFIDLWQILKLVTNPNAGRAAFHAIADREYEKVDSMYIQLRIIDIQSEFYRIEPCFHENGDIETVAVTCNRFAAPFQAIVDASWDVFRGAVVILQFDGQYTIIDKINESIAYVNAFYYHFRVCRSVLEDEVLRLDHGYSTFNEPVWMTIEMVNEDEVLARYCEKTRETRVKYDIEAIFSFG